MSTIYFVSIKRSFKLLQSYMSLYEFHQIGGRETYVPKVVQLVFIHKDESLQVISLQMTSPKVCKGINQRKYPLCLYLRSNNTQDLVGQKGNCKKHGLVLSPPIQKALNLGYLLIRSTSCFINSLEGSLVSKNHLKNVKVRVFVTCSSCHKFKSNQGCQK